MNANAATTPVTGPIRAIAAKRGMRVAITFKDGRRKAGTVASSHATRGNRWEIGLKELDGSYAGTFETRDIASVIAL